MIKNGIEIVRCRDKGEASKRALEILLKEVNSNTLLFLSGGASPDLLYQLIAQGKTLKPGAVMLVDERFGLPMHDSSNGKMISDTGLLSYINNEGIPFYRILKNKDMETTSSEYEQILKALLKKFTKKIAIMGIGNDGHTAGIKPDLEYGHTKLVTAYNDIQGLFGKRVTLTFEALKEIDKFIVLAFGENKKTALKKMFEEKTPKKIPAAFYTDLHARVILFTDISS